MTPNVGDIVLADFLQVGALPLKLRPALVLAAVPGPYQRWLLAGITTQTHQLVNGWDEPLLQSDALFRSTGLARDSVIRLSFLFGITESAVAGRIGFVPQALVARLRSRLGSHLQADF